MILINFLENSYIDRRRKRLQLSAFGSYLLLWGLTGIVALAITVSLDRQIDLGTREIIRLEDRLKNSEPLLNELRTLYNKEENVKRAYNFVYGQGLSTEEFLELLVTISRTIPHDIRLEEINITETNENKDSFGYKDIEINLLGIGAGSIDESVIEDWAQSLNTSIDGKKVEFNFSLDWSKIKNSNGNKVLAFEIIGDRVRDRSS